MKEYKFDVKKMTDTFNNFTSLVCEDLNISGDITNEQMSEMIQKHAFKLGYFWHNGEHIDTSNKYLTIVQTCNLITHSSDSEWFRDENTAKEIGLEFFSIKPSKMVTVKMPEVDFINMKPEIEDSFSIDYDKWELVE